MSSEGTLRDALAGFAKRRTVLIATDFDGVLAPIVRDPAAARPAAGTVEALRSLAGLADTLVAVVSGRDLETLRSLTGIGPSEPIVLVGSHGAEASVNLTMDTRIDDVRLDLLNRTQAILEPIANAHRGVTIERKPAGVVLHTRRAEAAVGERAVREASEATAGEPDLHVMHGKEILEFSVLDVSKGQALESLAALAGTEATLYLGDDVTDERAFAVLPRGAGHVSIKVGAGETEAEFRIAGSDEVLAVFEQILQVRGRGR